MVGGDTFLRLHKSLRPSRPPVVSLKMGKGFYIGKPLAVGAIILGVGAVATIIALSVVYAQEKDKNANNVSPTDGGAPTTPTAPTASTAPGTTAPPNQPWHKYRLPTSLSPLNYNVTLWPRLKKDSTTGLYIFTGKEEPSVCLPACLPVYPSVHPSIPPSVIFLFHSCFSELSRANQKPNSFWLKSCCDSTCLFASLTFFT